jgi:hypothetical protein
MSTGTEASSMIPLPGMMHPEPLLQIGAGEASASGSYALSTNRATLANLTNMRHE